MASAEEAKMSVTCEITHCKFATPEMSRAAYPAMVAHLQVKLPIPVLV